jgi:tyrosine-protein phosphatase SIW14
MKLCSHFCSRQLPGLLVGFLLFPALLPFLVCAQSATPAIGVKLRIQGVPNAGKLNDRLFRGAQPSSAAFAALKNLGITTIVDLRGENLPQIAWERQQAASFGIAFIHIPSSRWSPPSPEQVSEFLAIFSQDPQQKVFVHCRFGEDRTGVFIAAYRIAIDHWSAERATKEMYFFGFNWFWHPSMKTFIQNFPATADPVPALAPFRLQRPVT